MRLQMSKCSILLFVFGVVSLAMSCRMEAQEQPDERQVSDAIPRQVVDLHLQPPAIQQREEAGRSAKQEELDEILALRKSLGGGVISILGDLDGDAKQQLQADFEAELGRLMQQETQSPPLQTADDPSVLPLKPAVPRVGVAHGHRLPLIASVGPVVNVDSKIAAMRRVSRHLEELAWELEEINAYAEADQLRQQAQELRRKSRTMLERR